MRRPGFTIVELAVVLGILSFVVMGAIPAYNDFLIRSDLDSSTAQVAQGLGRARLLAQSGKEGAAWGFYVPAGVLFKGESYETRDPVHDETYPMPSTITADGPTEIVYSRLLGVPSATGTIILTTLNAEQRSILIEVKQESLAVIQNDRITICHRTGGNQHTLNIPDSAWPAHQAHGDTYGACPGSSSSSAAQSSSAASSVVSSAAASSAASSAVPPASSAASSSSVPACASRFSLSSNGVITILGSLNVTYTVIGSQLTYGAGGPNIDVTAKYRKNTGPWTDLFGGGAINGNGGQVSTVTGLKSGNTLITNFRAYFKQKGWLTYDKTYATNDGSDHVRILRDGDTPPSAAAYGGQTSLKTYLQSILDAQGKIDVGPYELVLLAEMGDCTNCASGDFQDAVVKMSFSQPTGCN